MQITQTYAEQGYVLLKNWLSPEQLQPIKLLLALFHQNWKSEHAEFYQTRAINSAYLTGKQFLSASQRQQLFGFLAQPQWVELVTSLLGAKAVFFNTQLFFDPVNPRQKNYWHRDPQYHLSIEQQQAALSGPEVLHFRLALADEPGIELVPGSHKRWDTEEELDIRLEKGQARNWHSLSTGKTVPLEAGDLLVFSANMLHRGLYGMQRFALDVLFAEFSTQFRDFMTPACLPEPEVMQQLSAPQLFQNSWELHTAPN